MDKNNSSFMGLNGRMAFFTEFLRHPLQVGSVIPSSRFLERRIVAAAGIAMARTVVELGPGTGGTTRAMLRAMPGDGRLLSIELNPRLHRLQQHIEDERLIAHLGSACDLEEIIASYGLGAPDAVVSGIPFSTMSAEAGTGVIEAVSSVLAPGGRFVAYQWSGRVGTLCEPRLGRGEAAMELRNIPPMRVYQWENRAGEPAL
ncbi:MAG: methyltransferase type 12 [Gammaproteobacteria bacterium]|nr:methyltransferase type 12 [Gammaproteobacteria bacterium]